MLYKTFLVVFFALSLGFASKQVEAQELICTYQLNGKTLSFPGTAPELKQSLWKDDEGFFISMDLIIRPAIWTIDSYDVSPLGEIYFTGTALKSLWSSWTFWPWRHDKFMYFRKSANNFENAVPGLFKLDPASCQVTTLLEYYGEADGEYYRYNNMTNVTVSPDGTKLLFDAAVYADYRFERKMYMLDLSGREPLAMMDFGGIAEYGADWTTQGIVFARVSTFGRQEIVVIDPLNAEPKIFEIKGTNPRWYSDGKVIFDTVTGEVTHDTWSPESREIPYQNIGAVGILNIQTGTVDYTQETGPGMFYTSWAQIMHYPHQQHVDAGWWWRCPSISIRVNTVESTPPFSYIQGTNYSPEQQLKCRIWAADNAGSVTFDLD